MVHHRQAGPHEGHMRGVGLEYFERLLPALT
jgi:hypothetical protein